MLVTHRDSDWEVVVRWRSCPTSSVVIPVVVFCGLAGAESTRERDHYYETPGNSFWELLHLSGLSPRRLASRGDASVVGPQASD